MIVNPSTPLVDEEERIATLANRINNLEKANPKSILGDILKPRLRDVCAIVCKDIPATAPAERLFAAVLRVAAASPAFFVRPLPRMGSLNGPEKLHFSGSGEVPPPVRRSPR
jgi:hypothetical protein